MILYVSDRADQAAAADITEELKGRISIEFLSPDNEEEIKHAGLILYFGEEGLSLMDGNLKMRGDFTEMVSRINKGRLYSEMLVKAAKIKKTEGPLIALDATAGMGEDSLLLATAGFQVQLYEYNPIIAALLKDTLRRAKNISELTPAVERMKLTCGDSLEGMLSMDTSPDLIYLDPMFPARTKSALIKKKFQLLQKLESPCMDEAAMLTAACGLNPRKIVIKRPLKGSYLAGVKPDYSISGKAIRYDCILGKTEHKISDNSENI